MQRQVRVRARVLAVGIALLIAIGAMPGHTANAATPTVGLGSAGTFSVLAGTPSITNTGATTIDRNVGIHPAASVTGFPPGIVSRLANPAWVMPPGSCNAAPDDLGPGWSFFARMLPYLEQGNFYYTIDFNRPLTDPANSGARRRIVSRRLLRQRGSGDQQAERERD